MTNAMQRVVPSLARLAKWVVMASVASKVAVILLREADAIVQRETAKHAKHARHWE